MAEVFYLGGSPCSGKSTTAEALAKRYKLRYYKADDFLDAFTETGAAMGKPICSKLMTLSADEIWLRSPELQNAEELEYYREIFGFIMSDLEALKGEETDVVAEGAAFLPELMSAVGVDARRYVAVVPTKEFQLSRYRARLWVAEVLKDCSDKETAFSNWMERDALFARDVAAQCRANNYSCIVNDGSRSVAEFIDVVADSFSFK